MSLSNAIYALSNINALGGSLLGYSEAKSNGASTGEALTDFGFNVMNGAIRNVWARDIQQHTGSYLGYAVNSAAGYGNPQSNALGTLGLVNATMITSPFGIFGCNPFMTSMIYNPFGGSFFGGGCCCNNNFMFPSFFGGGGFWC